MRYFKELYNEEKKDYEKSEITKAEAKNILKWHYNNVSELVEVPCLYRVPFGCVTVVEEEKK